MRLTNTNYNGAKSDREERYILAKKKIKKIKAFYTHLTVYILVNLYMTIKAFVNHGIEGVSYSLMGIGLFWGIGLFFHWYSVFGKDLLFSKDWEKRKIEEMMDADD